MKYYYDKIGNRLWYANMMGFDIRNPIETISADIDLSKAEIIEAEDISEVFVFSDNSDTKGFSCYSTIRVICNQAKHYAVMVIWEDSHGGGCIWHSLMGSFCFKEVYGYIEPKSDSETNNAHLIMKDLNNEWHAFSIIKVGGSHPVVVYKCRYNEDEKEKAKQNDMLFDLCEGGRIVIGHTFPSPR